MWGRTDLDLFAMGLKTCRNFFIDKHGSAVSRPGSTFVSYGAGASTYGKLIPFVQDDTSSYVCEFNGGGNLAIYRAGAAIAGYGVGPYYITHGYASTALSRLQYAQVGDIVTITHPLYTPMELKRWADWAPADFNRIHAGAVAVGQAAAYASFIAVGTDPAAEAAYLSAFLSYWSPYASPYAAAFAAAQTAGNTAAGATVPYTAWDALYASGFFASFTGGPAGVVGTPHWSLTAVAYASTLTPYWRDTDAGAVATRPPRILDTSVSMPTPTGAVAVGGNVGDATHPPREWVIQATQIVQHTPTGLTFETLPFTLVESSNGVSETGALGLPTALAAGNMLAIYSDRAVVYRRVTTTQFLSVPADAGDYRALATNYYRGRKKLMGFIGSTTGRDFVDVGAEPNYALQPPQGTNPSSCSTAWAPPAAPRPRAPSPSFNRSDGLPGPRSEGAGRGAPPPTTTPTMTGTSCPWPARRWLLSSQPVAGSGLSRWPVPTSCCS